ncbi:hypothetical protein [Streptomyces violascens]|uniref:hypothetical protein n=1 Tax=Streptomyces violascens TaxID=67381 RepID=UPI00167321A5|nr:hypothetical protein [Streptomyces violascens]
MGDVDDDGEEADENGPVPAPPTSQPPTPPRVPESGTATDEKADQERGGLLSKDTVGHALGKVMPGADDMVEKVPDWAWPLRAPLANVADPGTPVELEVATVADELQESYAPAA